jgi:hypothetical protein
MLLRFALTLLIAVSAASFQAQAKKMTSGEKQGCTESLRSCQAGCRGAGECMNGCQVLYNRCLGRHIDTPGKAQ